MRVPLSWLRDFAPFEGEPAELAASLDDLGLVVEAIEPISVQIFRLARSIPPGW